MGWTIVVGADDAGFEYKEMFRDLLDDDPRVDVVLDVGVDSEGTTPYPQVAIAAAQMIVRREADRGLLVCGTGLGVAIAANKVPGIRAVTAHDSYSVERSVLSNDAQVLTMGARVIGPELAKKLVHQWLDLHFDPSSPSAAKVGLIDEYERGAS